nr:TetR/AcrR family transcriptional regulator [Sedimentibacter sp.]
MTSKKKLQRKRMITYFVEATSKIIEEEGIEKVTIRGVADIAGYNSATLYNYFEDLDHLIFFASMKYLREYSLELSKIIDSSDDSLKTFFKIWECFCKFSFKKPQIFYNMFFSKHKNKLRDTVNEYYSVFPEDLGENHGVVLSMLKCNTIFERNKIIMNRLVDDNIIKPEDLDMVNRTIIYCYQGILQESIIENEKSVDQLIKETMKIIKHLIRNV